jgi:ferredoxin-thioredoxin reductase catalytic subunit/rubredoxin
MTGLSDNVVNALYERLDQEAEAGGYHLNPDKEFARELARSLLVNEERYGYWACPCRQASGLKEDDLDIVCPCDYRDADLGEYGSCYCALYVSDEIAERKKEAGPIPERRPPEEERKETKDRAALSRPGKAASSLSLPVWRCRVCGYLCARDGPPETCPVCRAKKDRFEILMDAGTVLPVPMPVWRCRVCGYLCVRDEPPETCPVCKAKKDRFEIFIQGNP